MIERRKRLDAVGDELVDEGVLEVEPLRIGRAGTLRRDARPGDREPIRCHAEKPSLDLDIRAKTQIGRRASVPMNGKVV